MSSFNAQSLVEAVENELGKAQTRPNVESSIISPAHDELGPTSRRQVEILLLEGKKPEAVKYVQEAHRMDLKTASAAVGKRWRKNVTLFTFLNAVDQSPAGPRESSLVYSCSFSRHCASWD
ncbi:hypothetical protein DQQ10_23260 [Pseudochryseolinea flava]|uniref:Uncharacterized protein n=1 Tax=Pseudochryseolinea flava TaxID=2059302 RepID=A0A364XWA4_9BACT|nr:hypothetical protein DQQ10_23260 [Pseudochryseolinea flava]